MIDWILVAVAWLGAGTCIWLWHRLADRNDRVRHERRIAAQKIAAEVNRQAFQQARETQVAIIEAWREARDSMPGDEWRGV